ncbi:MAG: SGNH/GDSL hydrolase family protein [Candidatus Hydrogenedentes bacterium]|nr:SGNH/GDSL hydrolase family protein [Candidatus Hydrogenedentota bacterium]
MKTLLLSVLGMLVLVSARAEEAKDFYLREGDRVVFYGDSITEQRLYTTYVETFVLTRYPELKVQFFPRGVGGDTAWGGWMGMIEERLSRDVKPCAPTVITSMLGMNDGGYTGFDDKVLAVHEEWYRKLIALMQETAPECRITLLGSSPYDDWAHPDTEFKGYNAAVARIAERSGVLAKELGFDYADFNAPVRALVETVIQADPPNAVKILPDAIHPGPSGHLVMAAALLKAWGATGVVSDVEIDAASGKVVTARHARVEGLSGLTWRQSDDALPFPMNKDYALAMKHTAFLEELNRQRLSVTGLEPGVYRLSIDGVDVTDATAEVLAQGINLAAFETPMGEQAARVLELTRHRVDLDFAAWREVRFNHGEYGKAPEALAALAALNEEAVARQREAARPVERVYALTLVP